MHNNDSQRKRSQFSERKQGGNVGAVGGRGGEGG